MIKCIHSLDELKIPNKHKDFLGIFLKNVAATPSRDKIEKLILFGSCARGDATENSDLDIVALGEEIDDNILWELYDCTPEYIPGKYVENDILAITNKLFNDHVKSFGMVQKYIAKEGVDLSGLLQ